MKLLFSFALVAAISTQMFAQQERTVTLVSGGVERTFLLHLPAAMPETGLPLLLCYHGAGGASEFIRNTTGFSDLADEYNFVVVYPQAVRINNVVQWNAYVDDQPGHGGVGADDAPDDVLFTHDIIDYVFDEYAIDKSHVYATGFSSGGFMSYGLAVMSPGTVQAIAPVSAHMWGNEAYVAQLAATGNIPNLPVMHTHGTADNIVSYIDEDNTPNDYGEYPLFLFSRVCNVHTYSKVVPVMENVDNLVFCEEPYEVSIIRIQGMEHSWSNGVYPTSLSILKFFGLASVQTDVAETTALSVAIAPNPATDILQIAVPDSAVIGLYDVLGREVYRTSTRGGTVAIPCTGFTTGMYTVQIHFGEQVLTRSVVIRQ